jgi:hypothetical protein
LLKYQSNRSSKNYCIYLHQDYLKFNKFQQKSKLILLVELSYFLSYLLNIKNALILDESEETSNGKQKQPNMNHNSSSSSLNVGTTAATIGNAPRPSLASPTTATTNVHLHPPHHHVGIARRRLSSASSTHSHHLHSQGLQEVDDRNTFIHTTRCPHRQCGYRFETISDMNTHLLIGHKTAETKAVNH